LLHLEQFSKPWLNFQCYQHWDIMLSLDLTSLCACCLGWLNFASRSRLFCVHTYCSWSWLQVIGAQSISGLYVCNSTSKCGCNVPGYGIVCSLSSASSFTFSGVLKACWPLKIIRT
jgi:hypothetical protein